MRKIDVLCVDDNEDFCFFITKALDRYNLELNYKIIQTGDEAMNKLKQGSDEQILPKLVFLDINLPGTDGMEILKTLKESNFYRNIPVVMLSTSDNPKDIERAVSYGANAYVSKPASFSNLKEMVGNACNFWLNYNETSRLHSA